MFHGNQYETNESQDHQPPNNGMWPSAAARRG
jgi:hypothetical protein